MRRAVLAVGTIAVVAALVACQSGPHGPGTLSVVVSGADVGAVVLEASGPGIQGFEGEGGTTVYSATVGTATGASPARVYRVIALSPAGGDLRLGIRMDNLRGSEPTLSVVSAVDARNEPMSSGEVHVSLLR